jgi:hypothetical protein
VTMLTEVIAEESARGMPPSKGVPHDWSPEFKEKYAKQFYPVPLFSRLLVALAKGQTWKYMATGQELPLSKWIVAQPRASVTFDELFRQSYRLCRGDVYLTLLTVENTLAKHWRNPERDNLAVTQRLSRITNIGPDGDKFGHWYHLVGIMLFGYVAGGLVATAVGDVETAGSHVLSHFEPEWQENWVNHLGGQIGNGLREVVEHKTYAQHQLNPAYLKSSYYLNLK